MLFLKLNLAQPFKSPADHISSINQRSQLSTILIESKIYCKLAFWVCDQLRRLGSLNFRLENFLSQHPVLFSE